MSMDSSSSMKRMQEEYRLVFIGPPGSGKGTQAAVMKEKYALEHISTGDLLRAEITAHTTLGQEAQKYMQAGALVPDHIILQMIRNVINHDSHNGFILDGFPRTVRQAEELDRMLGVQGKKLTAVVELVVEDRILVSRILGRLVHPRSGRTYHVQFNPPKIPMKDDVTGEALVRRGDDNEETLMKRMLAYHEMTAPVLEYYRQHGILHSVDASDKPSSVLSEIESFLLKSNN